MSTEVMPQHGLEPRYWWISYFSASPKWRSSMSSDRMCYLREDGGKLVKEVAPHRLGEAVPDALGSDEHASTPLVSVRVISSRMASRVSLLVTSSYGRNVRLVAVIGSLSRIWSRKTTRTLSLPLVLGLRPDTSANR